MNTKAMAKKLGQRGGRARAKRLSAPQLKRIASQGGQARAASYRAKKIIEENFRYLEFLEQFLPKKRVKREKNPKHRLPGIYSLLLK